MTAEVKACVICGLPIIGPGNDPAPISDNGRCCDRCNMETVLPVRIKQLEREEPPPSP